MQMTVHAVILLSLFAAAAGEQVNPVQQVLNLMDDVIAKIKRDGADQDAAYKEYMAWCHQSQLDFQSEIKSCESEIEMLQATISQCIAEVTASTTQIEEIGGTLAKDDEDLKALVAIREREHADFLKTEAELADAVDVINRAINVLKSNMQSAEGAALLQKEVNLKDVSKLAHVLNTILDGMALSIPDKNRLTALIQEHASEDSDDEDSENEDADMSLVQQPSYSASASSSSSSYTSSSSSSSYSSTSVSSSSTSISSSSSSSISSGSADSDSDEPVKDVGSGRRRGHNSRPSGDVMEVEPDDGLGAPSVVAYKHDASHSIIDILENMRDKAEEELADLRKAETSAQHNYEVALASLKKEITVYTKEMSVKKTTSASSAEAQATAQGQLSVTTKTCAENKASLASCFQACKVATLDHEAEVKGRAEELKALEEAKRIVAETTGGAEKASYGGASAASLLQLTSSGDRNFAVVKLLKKLAKDQHSIALTQLAGRVAATLRFSTDDDVFAKVKGLIKEMIDKLKAEAEKAATEKEYCDREMTSTKEKKDELNDANTDLTTKIDKTQSQIMNLKGEIADLQKALAELAAMQKEMDKVRAEEKAAFEELKADLTAGVEGVRRALEVLRDHYGGASFLQVRRSSGSPPNVDGGSDDSMSSSSSSVTSISSSSSSSSSSSTSVSISVTSSSSVSDMASIFGGSGVATNPAVPGGSGGYSSSGAGGSIISLLEVCESDFGKNLSQAEADEDTAQSEYEKTTLMNKQDKAQKEADMEFRQKEVVRLEKLLRQLKSDLQANQEELAAVLEYWKSLTAKCVEEPESYEERARRRQAEIDGLKEALRILTEEAAMVQLGAKASLRGVRRIV
eukprot:gnl/TRDRNA2_/TRDRNA2_178911_c0_seq1.p1 gnl/TRDRNA2_/TRDRNA2_178911_c0~~gnl/TRDRNA2_/TRDRNA2_178911_c0_seq1.p1  ORF type:complete len:860 (-),score=230.49 gnl/TRDRNA2_/TRDRNA2_178911_c0_seq1:58-2637(-)